MKRWVVLALITVVLAGATAWTLTHRRTDYPQGIVTGTLTAVSEDQQSACVEPDRGETICERLLLAEGTPPPVGTRVRIQRIVVRNYGGAWVWVEKIR